MRLNKALAQATGMGRRPADAAIAAGRVRVNGEAAGLGQSVSPQDAITLDEQAVSIERIPELTIILNKPAGYVVSRDGQGSRTIYDLLPPEYQQLKPVGRLDKDSSGLLVLTNNGSLANELTHPSRQKTKIYEVTLDMVLMPVHRQILVDYGVVLEDGASSFKLERQHEGDDTNWMVIMHEGRNRQIRRTFAALGYAVTRLHRTQFGPYQLGSLQPGTTLQV